MGSGSSAFNGNEVYFGKAYMYSRAKAKNATNNRKMEVDLWPRKGLPSSGRFFRANFFFHGYSFRAE